MKRAAVVIGATVAGLVGVLTYHTPGLAGNSAAGLGGSTTPSSGSGSGSTGAGTTTGNPAGAGTTAGASGATSPSNGGSSATQGSAPAAPPSKGAATSGAASSATGSNVQFGYGILSVKVTVSGKKITNVAVANLQVAESYSQQIAVQVIPMLRSEVLSAQSARINGISGATYTSEAFAQSLQSALTKLHFS